MLEHVSHVKRAGDVGRRDYQREAVRISGGGFHPKELFVHPPFGPVRLKPLGLIDLLDFLLYFHGKDLNFSSPAAREILKLTQI
jgi:hypothetical protein